MLIDADYIQLALEEIYTELFQELKRESRVSKAANDEEEEDDDNADDDDESGEEEEDCHNEDDCDDEEDEHEPGDSQPEIDLPGEDQNEEKPHRPNGEHELWWLDDVFSENKVQRNLEIAEAKQHNWHDVYEMPPDFVSREIRSFDFENDEGDYKKLTYLFRNIHLYESIKRMIERKNRREVKNRVKKANNLPVKP